MLLAAEQFVGVDPQRGVRLGPELTRIARRRYVDLAAIVQPYIDTLARETGETAAVTVLRDRAAVYIAQAVPDRTIVLASRVGAPISLHSTANGKALLAGLAEGLVRSLVGTSSRARRAAHYIDQRAVRGARGRGAPGLCLR